MWYVGSMSNMSSIDALARALEDRAREVSKALESVDVFDFSATTDIMEIEVAEALRAPNEVDFPLDRAIAQRMDDIEKALIGVLATRGASRAIVRKEITAKLAGMSKAKLDADGEREGV